MSTYFNILTFALLFILGVYLTLVSVTFIFFISISFENISLYYFILDYINNIDRFTVLSYLACAILSLLWLYKAHKNIEKKGIKDLNFSNKACVYWWFVPIWGFWKPYFVVREIYLASKYANNWKDKSALFIIIWWCIFLITMVLSRIVDKMPIPSMELLYFYVFIQGILTILYIKIVYSIYKFQSRISLAKNV